jgi:hypothetical protein
MSAGRGFSAGEEVAAHYVDRSGGTEGKVGEPLLVVRPFALALAKEIAYFSRTTREGGLESLVMRNPDTSVQGEGEKAAPVELKKRGLGALCEGTSLVLCSSLPVLCAPSLAVIDSISLSQSPHSDPSSSL